MLDEGIIIAGAQAYRTFVSNPTIDTFLSVNIVIQSIFVRLQVAELSSIDFVYLTTS